MVDDMGKQSPKSGACIHFQFSSLKAKDLWWDEHLSRGLTVIFWPRRVDPFWCNLLQWLRWQEEAYVLEYVALGEKYIFTALTEAVVLFLCCVRRAVHVVLECCCDHRSPGSRQDPCHPGVLPRVCCKSRIPRVAWAEVGPLAPGVLGKKSW